MEPKLSTKVWGAMVHILTASGAMLGLLALLAASHRDWSETFLWLGVALLVDGLDGPIARRLDVERVLPRFSGTRLDLLVDYLNYCVVPAFVITTSGLMRPALSVAAGILIVLSSLFHFSDRKSKTADAYFVGFPAIWNVVALYLFALNMRDIAAFAVIVSLSILTLVPIKWPHPFRVRKWRPLTLCMLAIWAIASAAALTGFPAPLWVQTVLIIVAGYMLTLTALRSFANH